MSEDWRNKLRKPKSDETKKKLSLARIGKPSHMKGKHLSDETKIKISKKLLGHITWNRGIHQPDYVKEAVRKANTNNKYRVGKLHTKETKEKIREKALLRPKRAWYNDGKIEKFILITEIDHYKALGYTRGRIRK